MHYATYNAAGLSSLVNVEDSFLHGDGQTEQFFTAPHSSSLLTRAGIRWKNWIRIYDHQVFEYSNNIRVRLGINRFLKSNKIIFLDLNRIFF